MTPASRRPGAPLAALGLVLAGWIAIRVMMTGAGNLPLRLADPADVLGVEADAAVSRTRYALPVPSSVFGKIGSVPSDAYRVQSRQPTGVAVGSAKLYSDVLLAGFASPVAPIMAAAVPPVLPSPVPTPVAQPVYPGEVSEKRWSADGWLLLRPGSKGGGILAAYGASQTGAVLRYRLAPGDGHRAAAYIRAAAALDGSRQRDAAVGLSARPLPDIPLVAAAEVRVTADRFGTRIRPAVLAYSEIAPFDLASGLRGEIYVQGGYVGGRDATAFVDGQLRADGKLADIGYGELRLGAGLWGGAQEGASRLDIGPAAQIALPLSSDVFARLALDWRFRVAGPAAPASGPALTLSAGF